jgi:acetyl-CoA C-acetyltransferase
LPPDGVPTITGGETFAGGPWNNFVLQTTAAMADRVRADPGATGLVTTVSGLLNKPGLAVYSTTPEVPLLSRDLAAEAERATERLDVVAGYRGPARVATYTVAYDGLEPTRCTVIADTPAGTRVVATNAEPELARQVTGEELIGTEIAVHATTFRV